MYARDLTAILRASMRAMEFSLTSSELMMGGCPGDRAVMQGHLVAWSPFT